MMARRMSSLPGTRIWKLRTAGRRYGLVAASFVIVAVVWEVGGRVSDFLFLPPLSAIGGAMWTIISDGTIPRELLTSTISFAVGTIIAATTGIVIGTAMALVPYVRYTLQPFLDALMSAPLVAFVPLFIILFGLGYTPRLMTVFFFAFFPVVVNTYTGMLHPDEDALQMARSFGASRRQLFWHVRLPMAFPHIAAGLRIGAARGVDGVITGEVLIASVGLGSLITRFGNAFTMTRLWAVVFVIASLALLASWGSRALFSAMLTRGD
jgi:NitT/TauT family transport system permease protein